MAEDQRVSVAAAADFIGTPDAARLIGQGWKIGVFRLHGVRPGERAPVEISPSEGGRVDCVASAVVYGALFTTYHSITMAWADVERLAQADAEWQLQEARTPVPPSPKQTLRGMSSAANMPIAPTKPQAVAWWLRHLFPDGRPAMQLKELAYQVRKEAGQKLGLFGISTLKRAMRLAWQPQKAGPNRAKPGQTSR
jgi:hypothetical protein